MIDVSMFKYSWKEIAGVGRGVIYILTNLSFPQYVKIGFASDLQRRLRELNRAETLPYAFRAYATYDVDKTLTDKALHELVDQLNPDLRTIETFNGKTRTKEFFEMSPEDVYAILEAIARISGTENKLHRVTPTGEQIEEEREAEEARQDAEEGRRTRFHFSMVGIKPGEKVVFANDPSKEAVVVDDTRVEYEGVTTSLSALAKEFLGRNSGVQDPLHFIFEGERLSERRLRMEGDK